MLPYPLTLAVAQLARLHRLDRLDRLDRLGVPASGRGAGLGVAPVPSPSPRHPGQTEEPRGLIGKSYRVRAGCTATAVQRIDGPMRPTS